MDRSEAARASCSCPEPVMRPEQERDDILADWDRGTLWAGILIAASFGSMFLIGGWLGW